MQLQVKLINYSDIREEGPFIKLLDWARCGSPCPYSVLQRLKGRPRVPGQPTLHSEILFQINKLCQWQQLCKPPFQDTIWLYVPLEANNPVKHGKTVNYGLDALYFTQFWCINVSLYSQTGYDVFLNYLCICAHVYISLCSPRACRCSQMPEGIGSPGAEVIDSCELLDGECCTEPASSGRALNTLNH